MVRRAGVMAGGRVLRMQRCDGKQRWSSGAAEGAGVVSREGGGGYGNKTVTVKGSTTEE